MTGFAYQSAPWRDSALEIRDCFLAESQRLSATGSFAWSVETGELIGSEELYRIFAIDADSAVSLEQLSRRVHPEDLLFLRQILQQARDGIAEVQLEARLLMPDSSVRYLHVAARCTRDERGCCRYIGAIQDVTKRRLAEEALEKARAELWHVARLVSLGALSASIAHEVNQPLSGIITNASTCLKMLDSGTPDVRGALETARRTLRDGTRAAEVIARLRKLFARQEAKAELVDLNEAAREVIALSRGELQQNEVSLRLELTEPLPPVSGDRVQLQQVILNLLLNASDAMAGIESRPRQLTVRTSVDEARCVRLEMIDSGVGLEADLLPQLSQPFCTTKGNGMGIGLFVSRSIVESHEGRLSFSANEGPGATFAFSIPQASASVCA